MGFRYQVGAIHRCRSVGGVIEVDYGGAVERFPTNLKTNTEWQTNAFRSDKIVFVLKSDDNTIIGRCDETIDIINKNGVLVGMTYWGAPEEDSLVQTGFYSIRSGMLKMYRRVGNDRCIFCGERTFVCDNQIPVDLYLNETESADLSELLKGAKAYSVGSLGKLNGVWYHTELPKEDLDFQKSGTVIPINQTQGLWRYAPGGPIRQCNYDYSTKRIGPYTVDETYGYVQRYYDKLPTPPYYLLWNLMENFKGMVACFFVNNTYICEVFPDYRNYVNISKAMDKRAYTNSEEIKGMRYAMVIGWVRTVSQCLSAACRPAYLLWDPVTNEVYLPSKEWTSLGDITPDVVVDDDLLLYKHLVVDTDKEAVFITNTGDKVYL